MKKQPLTEREKNIIEAGRTYEPVAAGDTVRLALEQRHFERNRPGLFFRVTIFTVVYIRLKWITFTKRITVSAWGCGT